MENLSTYIPEFYENLSDFRNRFLKRSISERTSTLCWLIETLPYPQAKFLHHALETHIASTVSSNEALLLEHNANDASFLRSVMLERPHTALACLLTHLPLLRPGNRDVAECYLNSAHKLFPELAFSNQLKVLYDGLEFIKFVFIHPAFTQEDKKTLGGFYSQLEQKLALYDLPCDDYLCSQPSDMKPPCNIRLARSNSLTPAQSTSHDSSHESLGYGSSVWSSQENLAVTQKPRSYSLSSDHPSAPPQGLSVSAQLTSSSSDTKLHDLSVAASQPVSKGIIFWLKSLRLHKYGWVFASLTYQQMMDLTDEQLQEAGITKGARHKLLINISKLKERKGLLTSLETDVLAGGDINVALRKLKHIIQTPLSACDPDDLSSLIVKVVGKISTQLLVLRLPSDECISDFTWICERAEVLEAFSDEQRRRLAMYRCKVKQACGQNAIAQRSFNIHHSNINRTPNGRVTPALYANFPSMPSSSAVCGTSQTTQQNYPQLLTSAHKALLQPLLPQHPNIQQLADRYNHKSSSYPNMNSGGGVQQKQQRMSLGNITPSSGNSPMSVVVTPPTTAKQQRMSLGNITPTQCNQAMSVVVTPPVTSSSSSSSYAHIGQVSSSPQQSSPFGMLSSQQGAAIPINIGASLTNLLTQRRLSGGQQLGLSTSVPVMATDTSSISSSFNAGQTGSSKNNQVLFSLDFNVGAVTSSSGDKSSMSSSSTDAKSDNVKKNNSDIENSLENLCLEMMEHALGP